ncbi:molybdopterin-dependent oxidoreductase [Marinomonas sp. 15G1-11]|uniref:Molybdopterin-dependent oxidoreductase n=1 Tax=Marinomonas phaeophyticola TaxID=3004091 RepID=A0ABT4JRR2_9GAMM|nr:molybdopterin-dependent oxidoreductase [Marinomonas sp. 15G1-11]MCZ2720707.1 molybdopterin-dependent oxidoreductase [Marinomonas sp. 15G1-11]
MTLLISRFFIMFTAVFFSTLTLAESMVKPTEAIVLTVTGNIALTNNGGEKAEFDLPMLESIGLSERATKTPWTDGLSVFSGVLIKDLLNYVGAQGSILKITALNDYTANIPIEDVEKYNVILAFRQNGKVLRIRDKGPLFVVYPFDEFPELNSEVIHNRSVWQVKSIEIE